MIITINNQNYEYENGLTLEKISKEFKGNFYCAKVNNRLRELTYKVNSDSTIEFLDLSRGDAMRIYQATLRYVITMALFNIDKTKNIKFSNSISQCLYAKIIGESISDSFLEKLEEEVKRIVEEDYPIKRGYHSIDYMINHYKEIGYLDKVENLRFRKKDVHVSECNGFINYMYSYTLPSTGYLKEYTFVKSEPGFLIQFPRSENSGLIPEFKNEPNFLNTLKEANDWANITETENIYQINDIISDEEKLVKYILECEARHSRDLCKIGDAIEKNISRIRMVAIAGPSSSGKTTFSKRVEIECLSRKIKVLRISLDNYYLPKEKCVYDESGQVDFEHINSLDINLFNQNMLDLLNGKEVYLPELDFKTKTTTFPKAYKLEKNMVVIIEGIHALNPLMTFQIPKENIYKIYIVPLAQRNIDNHNPISLTDLRLVRRIVRDSFFRSTSASDTIKSWKSVRNGERKWIYPFMENADFIFNSELGYELPVLKKYGLNSLQTVDYESGEYITANRLTKFLKIYKDISDDIVPNYSLLREFIGGSIFGD